MRWRHHVRLAALIVVLTAALPAAAQTPVGAMPEAILLIGPLYEVGLMARVALAYEQATAWKGRPPKVG
jgi:hypothetical protein